MTCKDCLHYAACKTMIESMGFIVDGAGLDADARCAEYAPRSPWISVEERMPKPFEPVILCHRRKGGELVSEQGIYDSLRDSWKVYGARAKRVTHWMPLPKPPEEE